MRRVPTTARQCQWSVWGKIQFQRKVILQVRLSQHHISTTIWFPGFKLNFNISRYWGRIGNNADSKSEAEWLMHQKVQYAVQYHCIITMGSANIIIHSIIASDWESTLCLIKLPASA